MNARPINCDLVNAGAGAADQRRLFLLWHQKWLRDLHQDSESEVETFGMAGDLKS